MLAPSDVDSLYFVARADGSGGHEFSSTIATHIAAPSSGIDVPSASKCVKQQLRDYLAAKQPPAITEAVWAT